MRLLVLFKCLLSVTAFRLPQWHVNSRHRTLGESSSSCFMVRPNPVKTGILNIDHDSLPNWYFKEGAGSAAAASPRPPIPSTPPPPVSDGDIVTANIPETLSAPQIKPSLPSLNLPDMQKAEMPKIELKIPDPSSSVPSIPSSIRNPVDAPTMQRPELVQKTIESMQHNYQWIQERRPELVQQTLETVQQKYQAAVESLSSHSTIPTSPTDTPYLIDYMRHPEKIQETLSHLPSTQRALEKLQSSIPEMSKKISSSTDQVQAKTQQLLQGIPVGKMSSSLRHFVAVLANPQGFTLKQAWDALSVDELGGWYVGAIGLLAAIYASVNSSRSSSSSSREVESSKTTFSKTQMTELSQATADVSQLLQQFLASDTEVASIRQELRTLQSKFSRQQPSTETITKLETEMTLLKQAESKLEQETSLLRQELQRRQEAEDFLRQQVQELEKKLLQNGAGHNNGQQAMAAAAQTTKVTKAPPPPPPPEKPTPVQQEDFVLKPAFFPSIEGPAFFASIVEPTTTATDEDWSRLSPSALEKKTVDDLREYLQAKGISSTDENGKTLGKDALIKRVMSGL